MKPEFGYAGRCVALALGSLAIAGALSLTDVMKGIELKLGDSIAHLTAPVGDFSDVVVVDVDEQSMARLEPQIGPWPYDRDVYALVNRYLLQADVAAIAYDILFSEARRGDDEFAATLTRQVVLPVASLPFGSAGHNSNYKNQLAAAAWAHGDDWPAKAWDDLTLPLDKFITQARVGVISLEPDADGILRRVPLLHKIHGEVLPALATSVLKVIGVPVEVDAKARKVRIAGTALPEDAEHLVSLRYPRDFLNLRIVPFYQVALAASGSKQYASLAQSLRGKTIYIGSSSAVLGDFIQTPIGRAAGLYVVATLPTMLKNSMIFQPRGWALDGLLTALFLALALVVAQPRLQRSTALQILTLPGLVLLTAASVVAFNLGGLRVALLLPLTVGLLAHLGALIWRQIHLFRKSQLLLVEKLAAEEANRLKGQFLSHMTHELRTPLTAILGFNNINWKSDALGRSERIKNGEVIDRNGRHLLTLINGILDQAKLAAGQVRIVTHPESVRDLVNDVLATAQPLLQGKPVSLQASFAMGMPDVFEIDAFRVRQILLNLVGNAIKFTGQGTVAVKANWIDASLRIEVADTGPGLSSTALSRLFVAFQQADDSVGATHGGTGLGLTISRDLASLMQGKISVSSELGAGTSFILSFPAKTASITTAMSEPQADSLQSTTPAAEVGRLPKSLRGTVLVAEDANDLRALAVVYLKRLGLTVLEAVNGQEAVVMAMRDNPSAILMDLEMPILHGLDAVKTLRSLGFSRPILAMTAHTGEPHRTQALAAGCNDIISKPVSYAALRATLDGALSARANSSPD